MMTKDGIKWRWGNPDVVIFLLLIFRIKMHFGKRLEKDLVERWKSHYLQYKLLKKQIKELEQSAGNKDAPVNDDAANGLLASQQISYQEFSFPGPRAHRFGQLSAFKPFLDKEVQKINDFSMSKVKELQNRLLQLLRTPAPWKDQKDKPSNTDLVEWQQFLDEELKETDTIAQELVDLDKFIRQNCIAVQKIIKKFDKRLNFDVAPWLNAQLMENEPFLKLNLDAILMALSDSFEKLSHFKNELNAHLSTDAKDETKKGISAQTFERKTTKYWVRSENLMRIKVAILKV
jgi:SPX domain protein involved in polyphosphate accumulation